MEHIYDPDKFSATEPIDLEKYFKEYERECNINKPLSDDVFVNRLEILKDDFKLPLSLDDIKELEGLCTVDKLKVLKENTKLPLDNISKDHRIPETHPITEESRTLYTVKSKEEFSTMKDELQMEIRSLKMWFDYSKNNDPNPIRDIQPGSNFIHKVQIFIPFNTLLGNKLSLDNVRIQYEIEVLGTNTLLELANSIKCVSDLFIIKEVPNMQVDFTHLQNAKEEYPSRCFFIENVFYNDMSHPNAVDYSEVVKKWAAEKKIGDFKSESMENVTFASLKPRLGYGYVYIHQGNCEHIVSFTDARLIQNTDCLDSKKYPRIVSMKRHMNYLCFICLEHHSSWMVVNSDRLPVRKAFFCTRCCESYMFLDGKKIGDFQLYPYSTGTLAATNEEDKTQQDENDWGYICDN